MLRKKKAAPEKVTFEQRPAEPREDGYRPIKQRFGMIAGLPGRLARCPALRRKEQIKIRREESSRNRLAHCPRCHLVGPGSHQRIELLCLHSRQDTHCSLGAPQSCRNVPASPDS